jgi:hypothetical protein
MGPRAAASNVALTPAATRPRKPSEHPRHADPAAGDQASALARAALAFAERCHAGQRRESDGAPFIEHPLEVERLLRDAGCSDLLAVAGLLHDVIEHARVSVFELTSRFGADVAHLVQAVTDDAFSPSYRLRKQMLCEQVGNAGGDAALLFAAEKISKVRELPGQIRRDRARFGSTARGSRARNHLEHYHQMRFEHYQESLRMLQRVAAGHPLVRRLENELESCPISIRPGAIAGRAARMSRDAGRQGPDEVGA